MKFEIVTAAAVLAVSAVCVTAATAQAAPSATQQPAVMTAADTISGVDHGIDYRVTVSPVDGAVVTTVANGEFRITRNGAVTLESADGVAVTEVPQQFTIGERSIAMAQHIGADGRTLRLTPTPTAEDIAELRDISSYDRLKQQIDKNMPGVVGGAIVGGLLGACLPLIWGISIPAGVLIGGTVGGYIVGGPEFLGAVEAFATGRP
ncbi:hypothetical protein ACWCPQ_15270 [Nocardia sp. NPDC001965]